MSDPPEPIPLGKTDFLEYANMLDAAEEFLREEGYDGLYHVDGECFCDRNEVSINCGGEIRECFPGWRQPCDCDKGCDYHIGPKKPEGKKEERDDSAL